MSDNSKPILKTHIVVSFYINENVSQELARRANSLGVSKSALVDRILSDAVGFRRDADPNKIEDTGEPTDG